MPFRLFATFVVLLTFACEAVAAAPAFTPSSLLGVWEMVACESLSPRQAGSPATTPNFKYCFGAHAAYPELSPESASDSADGSGDYYLVGGDILVIRTGVPGGLYAFQLDSVSSKQLVWQRNGLRVTLRRVAGTWDGRHTPKLRPQNIRISYPP